MQTADDSTTERRSFRPLFVPDVALAAVILGTVIAIWYAGDFHGMHHGDIINYSLTSLYHWTVFPWEYDHTGTLVPLLLSFVKRPYWNLFLQATLTSLFFLGGLTLWGSLLSLQRTGLAEGSIWVGLLLPLVMAKGRIFSNAAHAITSGASFFFAGLYTLSLLIYLRSGRSATKWAFWPVLFVLGFLATYLAKTMLIPLGSITLGMIWEYRQSANTPGIRRQDLPAEQVPLSRPGQATAIRYLAPPVCLATALLVYQLLEMRAPVRSDFALSFVAIPEALPRLVRNWADQELTTPLVLVILLPALLYTVGMRSRNRQNHLLGYLICGLVLETLVVSSSRWVVHNHYSGHYLTNWAFLLVLAAVVVAAALRRQLQRSAARRGALAAVGLLAVAVNLRVWNVVSPAAPFAAFERTIGAHTATIVTAECDVIVGDYWKVWPAVFAANDYYFREHIVDARTHQLRWVAGLAYRAQPTAFLWRPRLDWPDVKLCSFQGDEAKVHESLTIYAPHLTFQTVPTRQLGQIVVREVAPISLPAVEFDFDQPVPGTGWSWLEVTPFGESFQWTNAAESTLILPLNVHQDLTIQFRIVYAMSPDILQSLRLYVNQQPIALTSTQDEAGATIFQGLIAQSTLARDPRFTQLTFRVSRTAIPRATIPGSDDTRTLGVAYDWLRIDGSREGPGP